MNRFEDRDILERTAQLLDLPVDVVAGFPNLELLGDRQLFLTRHRGILSYSDTAIDVNCGELLVRVRGRGLELLSMTAEEMRIGGVISSVELAR
ncbi:MAG TPA: YabP/YqfC family sporulation protein [Firmicutes bacterium]|nr:YabP/YqfC family sporulation protein [Bacillota bacterium]